MTTKHERLDIQIPEHDLTHHVHCASGSPLDFLPTLLLVMGPKLKCGVGLTVCPFHMEEY
ncbi:hypothetical protein E2C01_023581 [Portunus trituberculatus]|uniref:Uncharacterized protein n=1 Tax=Portunus trituberculatus TaxID=210409 RepID=A0A5B7E8B2_PORTR|nr:hypothetical protein [Portunus trituberculatus]